MSYKRNSISMCFCHLPLGQRLVHWPFQVLRLSFWPRRCCSVGGARWLEPGFIGWEFPRGTLFFGVRPWRGSPTKSLLPKLPTIKQYKISQTSAGKHFYLAVPKVKITEGLSSSEVWYYWCGRPPSGTTLDFGLDRRRSQCTSTLPSHPSNPECLYIYITGDRWHFFINQCFNIKKP